MMETDPEVEAVKPRESVQVARKVIGPGAAPVVVRVAELPLPAMEPALDVQLPTVIVALSGLVQEQVMVAGVPASTADGLTEQETCGGFSGLTVKLEVQLAVLFFLDLASVMVAVAV